MKWVCFAGKEGEWFAVDFGREMRGIWVGNALEWRALPGMPRWLSNALFYCSLFLEMEEAERKKEEGCLGGGSRMDFGSLTAGDGLLVARSHRLPTEGRLNSQIEGRTEDYIRRSWLLARC